jgi:flagellar assembly protein FliH
MIIKRRNNSHSLPGSEDALLSGGQNEPFEAPVEWNEDTVDSGLAPERRTEDRRNDRRRGYRRIEDKDLISKAYQESVAIKERAEEEGFLEGLAKAEAAIAELRENMAQLMNGREEALLSVAQDIGSLSVEVAARIIKTEVSCDETLVMGMVKDTIQKLGRNTKSVLVKINPEDAANVRRFLKEDPIPNLNAEIIIMEDAAVDLGSCIVETNSGLIDASFATQLGILRKLFSNTSEGGR